MMTKQSHQPQEDLDELKRQQELPEHNQWAEVEMHKGYPCINKPNKPMKKKASKKKGQSKKPKAY